MQNFDGSKVFETDNFFEISNFYRALSFVKHILCLLQVTKPLFHSVYFVIPAINLYLECSANSLIHCFNPLVTAVAV
jgi:hypothetical protein